MQVPNQRITIQQRTETEFGEVAFEGPIHGVRRMPARRGLVQAEHVPAEHWALSVV
jgi:hypothetical protein